MKLELTTTPTYHELAFRAANFATLTEALDYAALGETGANFFTGFDTMYVSLPYRELREQCIELAGKLLGLGLKKGDQVDTPQKIRVKVWLVKRSSGRC